MIGCHPEMITTGHTRKSNPELSCQFDCSVDGNSTGGECKPFTGIDKKCSPTAINNPRNGIASYPAVL